MLRLTNLTGFGASQSVDTTPATITSASSTTVDGQAKLAFTVTTDKATTLAIGGTDAAQVEIALNNLSTTHVLRWSSDGVRSHDSPADAGGNNVYDITITPAGGTPQNFSITVGIDWFDTFEQTLTQESSGWPSANLRCVIDGSLLSTDGTDVRLWIACPQVVGGIVCDSLYIGQQAASGDPYDMEASAPAPVQLQVGASNSFAMTLDGADVVTDGATFTIDKTKNYVIAAHFVNDSFGGMRHEPNITGADSYISGSPDSSSTPDVSMSILTTNRVTMVTKIQVHS